MIDILKRFFKKYLFFIFLQKINTYFLKKKHSKVIFYQPQRSSGTSLKFFFWKYFGRKVFYKASSTFRPFDNLDDNYIIFQGHRSYIKSDKIKKKYEFTIIRNPLDALISLYFKKLNLSKTDYNQDKSIVEINNFSISDFVNHQKKYYSDNSLTRMFCDKFIFSFIHKLTPPVKVQNTKYPFLNDKDKNLAIENLKKINVFIYETLDRKKLYKTLGTKFFILDKTNYNKSMKSHIISDEDKKKLLELCVYDFEIYNLFLKNQKYNSNPYKY